MARLAVIVAGLTFCLLPTGCATPEVAQGTVVRSDPDSHLLVIQDQQAPGDEIELDTATAVHGAAPAVGDQVRVSYHEEDGKLVAERVMNVTRQDERRAGGH